MIIGTIGTYFLILLQFFKLDEIMARVKYGHLMAPGALPGKVTPDTDFTNEAVAKILYR